MQLKIEGIDFSKTLGPWIGKTYKMLDEYMEGILIENNVPIKKQQWLVLNLIKTNIGINQNELACFVNRDKTSITRFINNLEKKGYIKREYSAEDKRVKLLCLTQKGIDTLDFTTPIIKKAALDLQNEISLDEVKVVIKSLKKIQEKINYLKNK